MTTVTKRRVRNPIAILASAVLVGTFLVGGPTIQPAQAIIGRPLTPMSYAGVARRTARRTAYVGAAATAGAVATAGVATAATAAAITTLPAGCAQTTAGGAVVYGCGGAYYKPYYDGPNLVYQPIPPP
jgi:hypothetical protein